MSGRFLAIHRGITCFLLMALAVAIGLLLVVMLVEATHVNEWFLWGPPLTFLPLVFLTRHLLRLGQRHFADGLYPTFRGWFLGPTALGGALTLLAVVLFSPRFCLPIYLIPLGVMVGFYIRLGVFLADRRPRTEPPAVAAGPEP